MDELEERLRRRHTLREERFEHAGLAVDILLPDRADELIDVSDFNTDERLPYWAEIWPSARALTRHLLEREAGPGPVLELGCGVALPSLAMLALGRSVIATDYYAEALEFARLNALRNGLGPLNTLLVDWRDPPRDLARFPLVVAADVLYEMRNAEALATLLPSVLAPGGSFLLADPRRAYRASFDLLLRERGWSAELVAERTEPSGTAGGGTNSRISLLRYQPPADQNR